MIISKAPYLSADFTLLVDKINSGVLGNYQALPRWKVCLNEGESWLMSHDIWVRTCFSNQTFATFRGFHVQRRGLFKSCQKRYLSNDWKYKNCFPGNVSELVSSRLPLISQKSILFRKKGYRNFEIGHYENTRSLPNFSSGLQTYQEQHEKIDMDGFAIKNRCFGEI